MSTKFKKGDLVYYRHNGERFGLCVFIGKRSISYHAIYPDGWFYSRKVSNKSNGHFWNCDPERDLIKAEPEDNEAQER